MAESIAFTKAASRSQNYSELIPQIESLIAGEKDTIANLANIAAVLKEAFGFFWVGFYLVKDGQLVLGPFQGPLACTRIDLDKGVCGAAYTKQQTIIVANVDEFPGHIACNFASRSEIVVPVFSNPGKVFGVLDVDSDKLSDFGEDDRAGLERICTLITRTLQISN
jgi:L-methionine (R)-S-oxide reductase